MLHTTSRSDLPFCKPLIVPTFAGILSYQKPHTGGHVYLSGLLRHSFTDVIVRLPSNLVLEVVTLPDGVNDILPAFFTESG
jgi:hypothetical protein